MKNLCMLLFSIFITIGAFIPGYVFAIEDPRIVPNNKVGIHILFPQELENAAQLVNSNGGDWGYVTVPIQAGEKDIEKWQKFMDIAKEKHIIPIIRLATEGDYFNTKVWRKPNFADILDFANFLNSLQWPTENRYVSVFNEVNRADEWGGEVNASEYVQILSYATTAFKSLNQNFFILSAGLDNGAPTLKPLFQNQYEYLSEMAQEIPDIFSQIDGISSHSYPNPGFSQSPYVATRQNVFSFRFEKNLIDSLSGKDLPVFITETGWDNTVVNSDTIANYYTTAFSSVWNDSHIVAVTPFLLRAGPPFAKFSFVQNDGSLSSYYKTIQSLQKIKGEPKKSSQDLKISSKKVLGETAPVKNFSHVKFPKNTQLAVPESIKIWLRWLLKI